MEKSYSNINHQDPVNHILGFCLASLLSFAFVSAIIMSSLHIFAVTSQEDEVSITVPSSCTMGGNIASGDEHTTTLTPGTYSGDDSDYANGIGKTTLTTFCNDYNGFSIYAIGYTGNTYGNNTLTGTNTGVTIPTGVYASGDTTSKWSMKVNKVTDSTTYNPNNMTITNSFSDWHNVPSTYTQVASYHASTGSSMTDNDLGAKVTTTYAAYVSTNQAADTYQGQVKYTMVHPYNATEPPLTIATADYLQDVESCPASLPEEQVYTLRDSRDNQEYKVAKLKDGKCWMLENLNLAGGTALSATDTDVSSDYIDTFTTGNGLTKNGATIVLPASATKNLNDNNLTDETSFSINHYAYVFNSGNKENCGAMGQNAPCYSYYSWKAASLGSTVNSENTDTQFSICPKKWHLPSSRDGTDSNSDFRAFIIGYGGLDSIATYDSSTIPNGTTIYNSISLNSTPHFILAGYYGNGKFSDGGSIGYYRSATSISNSSARILSLSSNNVSSARGFYRYRGLSVRCLFSGQ